MSSATEISLTAYSAIAAGLIGSAVDSIRPGAAGGNNRVFRVEAEGRVYALKQYPVQDRDTRDRLTQEYEALRFLRERGIDNVPTPRARELVSRCALYDWIDGRPIDGADDSVLQAMAQLTERLIDFGSDPEACSLVAASAGCFSGADVTGQIEHRLSRLRQTAAGDETLAGFLDVTLEPAIQRFAGRARAHYADAGLAFDRPLPQSERILSPSDFGFHNGLRTADGRIHFLDFEYFGWDDPIKLVSDARWHAGMGLDDSQGDSLQGRIRAEMTAAQRTSFDARFGALHPLFGLMWCLIVLNEFLPERWTRRNFSGPVGDRAEVLARQLNRARDYCTRVESLA